MSSIMRRRSGLMALSVIGDAPVVSLEVANPDLKTGRPVALSVLVGAGCRSARPRERFSPLTRSGPPPCKVVWIGRFAFADFGAEPRGVSGKVKADGLAFDYDAND